MTNFPNFKDRFSLHYFIYSLPLALIAGLCFWVNTFYVYKAELAFDITVEKPGHIELFFDLGDGQNYQSIQTVKLEANKRTRVIQEIPWEGLKILRIDPNSNTGWCRIENLTLANHTDIPIQTLKLEQFRAYLGISNIEYMDGSISLQITDGDPMMWVDYDFTQISKPNRDLFSATRYTIVLILTTILVSFIGHTLFGKVFSQIGLGVVAWLIFCPGIYTPDSIWQIEQAMENQYSDWHPPTMSILIHYWLKIGLPVAYLSLFQAILLFLGLYYLYQAFWSFTGAETKTRTQQIIKDYGILVLTIILTSPISPLAPYSVTLWKDVWFTVSLLWMTVISLYAYQVKTKGAYKHTKLLSTVLVLVSLVSVEFRHNAIVVLPVIAIILTILLKKERWISITQVVLLALLFTTPFITGRIISHLYPVEKSNPKMSMMSLELVGLLVLRPELMKTFPNTAEHLDNQYAENFQWAGYRYLKWPEQYGNPIVDENYLTQDNFPSIQEEYYKALRLYPFSLLRIKLTNYLQLLNPMQTIEWVTIGISSNNFGLSFNDRFQSTRKHLNDIYDFIILNNVTRWISGVHLIYLIITAAIIATLIYKSIIDKSLQPLYLAAIFTTTLAYYLSYIIATVWTAFRYMYPSTLIVQHLLISMLIIWLTHTFHRANGNNTPNG